MKRKRVLLIPLVGILALLSLRLYSRPALKRQLSEQAPSALLEEEIALEEEDYLLSSAPLQLDIPYSLRDDLKGLQFSDYNATSLRYAPLPILSPVRRSQRSPDHSNLV